MNLRLNCTGKLEMGKEMTAKIQLCPPPKPFNRTKEFEVVNRDLDTTLTIKVPNTKHRADILRSLECHVYFALSILTCPKAYSLKNEAHFDNVNLS